MPNFLMLGTPKAGTTAIYNYLKQHPQIYMPPFKEPHFFSFEGEQKPHWGIQTLEDYQALFQEATSEQIIGEASTWYLYSQTAAERIRHHIPEAKLIAILRNPIERAYSSWAFRVQCGWESITDFQKALQAEPQRIRENPEWDFHYLKAGFYYDQIKRYLDIFPSEQIKIIIYEDFKSDPVNILEDIYKFIGVDENLIPDLSQKHNVTYLPKNNLINLIMSRKSIAKDIFKSILPSQFTQVIANQLRKGNQAQVPPLSSEIKQHYIASYQEDISKLEQLIDRDLSVWEV
ncbi:MAG: sulfotransferase [Cyanobacteria bacterium J06592_8]